MSDLVSYHPHNPDPLFGGCRNTGTPSDGVIFHGVEPMEGVHTFIGRQSLLEAIGALFSLGPRQVSDRLSAEAKPQERIRELESQVETLKAKLAEREAFFDALREQGFIAPELT